MKRCVIICNPNSGHNKKKAIIKKFKPILEEKDYTTEVKYTKYGGHAEKIIENLDNDIDLVISLGGDGTFNEVVTGNIKRKEIDVKLTNKPNSDGTTGAPILYANIPIVSIKNESRIAASEMKEAKKEEPEDVAEKEEIPETVEEIADEDNQEEAEESPEEENVAEKEATKKA